jgi:hypothetical protein
MSETRVFLQCLAWIAIAALSLVLALLEAAFMPPFWRMFFWTYIAFSLTCLFLAALKIPRMRVRR